MANDGRMRILEAAKALAESHDSVQGVTISLESVAQKAGLTKPGLMYHFPSKEALMLGLVGHAAEDWAQRLRAHTGRSSQDLTSFDRHRAYITVATTAEVSRADYWIFSDALYHPKLSRAWSEHLGPWFDTTGLDARAVSLLTAARFCADGAWMSEATGVFPSDDLAAVCRHALALIDTAEATVDAAEAVSAPAEATVDAAEAVSAPAEATSDVAEATNAATGGRPTTPKRR